MTRMVTRQAAIEDGLKYYHSNTPCPKGHVGQRYTRSCNCVQCIRDGQLAASQKRTARARAKAASLRPRAAEWGNRVAVISSVNIPQI